MYRKLWIGITCALVVGLVSNFGDAKPSSSSGSSSRSSSSSKPSSSYGSSSSSKPSSSYSSKPSGSSSKSMFGSGSGSTKPSDSGSKPMFGSGSGSKKPSDAGTIPSGSKPLYGSGSGSSQKPSDAGSSGKPMYGSSKPPTNSYKPDNISDRKPQSQSGPISDKARANKQESSRREYENSQPKPYASGGKEMKIDPSHSTVNDVRNKPYNDLRPEVRQQHTEVHIHNYGYGHPYNWYYTQPSVYVGGGYSSAFWWMMMEWDANRRAEWLYHNQDRIEQDAYRRGMQDAAVARRIAELREQGVRPNPNYVDKEFRDDPTLMLDQGYIDAIHHPDSDTAWLVLKIFMWSISAILLITLVVYLVFVKKW